MKWRYSPVKMTQPIKSLVLSLLLVGLMVAPASALDISFDGSPQYDFYQSTNYEDVYGAEYQYGGVNPSDFDVASPAYGLSISPSIGVLDKATSSVGTATTTTASTAVYSTTTSTTGATYSTSYTVPTVQTTQFTAVSDVLKSNGTLGTISIPSLGITATVKPDETMSYSVGHISSTSAWNGNVGICGHNRGASVVIGDIKDLDVGDIITYSTDLGTRTYAVTVVTQISNTDWSYLTATTDNRITLITCVEDNSDLRWVVQAVEI